MTNATSPPLLSVRGLKVHFPLRSGPFSRSATVVRAVDGVSFDIHAGETVALVGESGCGKSTTGNAILGLTPVTAGEIVFDGRDLARASPAERHNLAGEMQVIFQDPASALDPKMSVGDSIAEPLVIRGVARMIRRERIDALLDLVGLQASQADRHPNELSGGQRQRVVIARALALSPRLLVCDEPVSALDVSIRSQILNLLMRLQRELGLAYLFISHDLSVVRHIADRIAVMYLGTITETGGTDAIFAAPIHPYTQALLSAIPLPDPAAQRARSKIILSGELPSPADQSAGCPFLGRCPIRQERCAALRPALVRVSTGTEVACLERAPAP
jgi:oligopeptide transport system ATP-binding protein